MTSSTAAAPRPKRNLALVVLDTAVGIALVFVSMLLGLAILASAVQYRGLQVQCGAGPYAGLTCNGAVLAIVVYGLMTVAILGFFLGLGFFIVNLVRKRYGFYLPLIAIVLMIGLFYLGTWLAGLTVP